MFKVHERNGVWAVSKDSANVKFIGGETIDYEAYKELRDQPEEAGKHFRRDSNNKLVLKKPKKTA